MAILTTALADLQEQRSQAQQQIERLDEAIAVIEGLVGRDHAGRRSIRSTRRSAAARRRMSLAQKARWAKAKGRTDVTSTSAASLTKRTMSAAARRKIAAAQRARWATWKAQQKKAA